MFYNRSGTIPSWSMMACPRRMRHSSSSRSRGRPITCDGEVVRLYRRAFEVRANPCNVEASTKGGVIGEVRRELEIGWAVVKECDVCVARDGRCQVRYFGRVAGLGTVY